MDLTDQYLQYLRDTGNYKQLERHYAGYPEEPEEDEYGNDSFADALDAMSNSVPQQRNTSKAESEKKTVTLQNIGFVLLFKYPNVPANKVAIRVCIQPESKYLAWFEDPDDLKISDEVRTMLYDKTHGDCNEIANNVFIVDKDIWDTELSKNWFIGWDYEMDFLADKNGNVRICEMLPCEDDDSEDSEDEPTLDEIENMDDDEVINIWLWDGNLENGKLVDYTPYWMYAWMDEFFEDEWGEEMESLFSITVRDYKRLMDFLNGKK